MNAIGHQDASEVKRLLDSGADPNEESVIYATTRGIRFHLRTPLAYAVENKCDTTVLLLLLDHGANINLYDSSIGSIACSPLWYAINNGSFASIRFLLSHHADPNLITNRVSGQTPLEEAVSNRDIIIENNTHWRDSVDFGDTSHAHAQMQYDTIIDMLLQFDASPSRVGLNGSTPLHLAAQFCDSISVAKFLLRGASPNAKNKDGDTPLSLAKNCTDLLAIFQRYKK